MRILSPSEIEIPPPGPVLLGAFKFVTALAATPVVVAVLILAIYWRALLAILEISWLGITHVTGRVLNHAPAALRRLVRG